jgi:hypothetical protein
MVAYAARHYSFAGAASVALSFLLRFLIGIYEMASSCNSSSNDLGTKFASFQVKTLVKNQREEISE